MAAVHPTSVNLRTARLDMARGLAWALLLGGWIGIASLATMLAPDPLVAFALIALWLLALGAFAALLGHVRLGPWWLRGLLFVSAVVAARGLPASVHGGGLAALLPALLAWALLVALASATVRSLRLALRARPGPPILAAAAGAGLAWWVLGDVANLPALALRLAGLALLAAPLLASLLSANPAGAGARPGCRAGLFDCSLPAWPQGGWKSPQRWPVLLASLVMLPMMCSLPQMLMLCRSESVSVQAMLGLHLGAMFVPALLLGMGRPSPQAFAPERAALFCGVLLSAGGAAAWLAEPTAWWWLALAHGSAWSVAWAAQLADPALRAGVRSPPLRAATAQALFALWLGLAVTLGGVRAVFVLQLALAAAAVLALAVLVLRHQARPLARTHRVER